MSNVVNASCFEWMDGKFFGCIMNYANAKYIEWQKTQWIAEPNKNIKRIAKLRKCPAWYGKWKVMLKQAYTHSPTPGPQCKCMCGWENIKIDRECAKLNLDKIAETAKYLKFQFSSERSYKRFYWKEDATTTATEKKVGRISRMNMTTFGWNIHRHTHIYEWYWMQFSPFGSFRLEFILSISPSSYFFITWQTSETCFSFLPLSLPLLYPHIHSTQSPSVSSSELLLCWYVVFHLPHCIVTFNFHPLVFPCTYFFLTVIFGVFFAASHSISEKQERTAARKKLLCITFLILCSLRFNPYTWQKPTKHIENFSIFL